MIFFFFSSLSYLSILLQSLEYLIMIMIYFVDDSDWLFLKKQHMLQNF